ncbi:MAG: hypothetical protein ACFFE4_15625 [Candidatus Thorarchaeota archaeon]
MITSIPIFNTAKQNVFLSTEVEGLKIKSEVIWELAEAYKIIGMTSPES